jgi:hypothetical protein
MRTVYFDSNVYNDIERGAIGKEEVAEFRGARDRGELLARLGLPDLEECIGLWSADREAALRRLRIARDLVGFDNVLKQPADILAGAFQAYAAGQPQPTPMMARRDRKALASFLDKIASGRKSYDEITREILSDIKSQKEEAMTGMKEALTKTLAKLHETYTKRQLAALPFNDLFLNGAEGWIEGFARRHGLAEACRSRGLEGLLALRVVRLWTGTVMSLIHSMIAAGREPDFGDGYDIWHAILASTADVFVTKDQQLYDHVARVPGVDGFRVVKSIREALA